MEKEHREHKFPDRQTIRPFQQQFRQIRLFIAAAAVVLVLAGGVSTLPNVSAAQDAGMSGHPLVGSWIIDADGETSLAAFTSDGIVIDTENSGLSGIGSWVATGERSGAMTLILPYDGEFTGNLVIRATLAVNETGDAVSVAYSITGVGLDGVVVFSDAGTGSAIRLPVESPDMAGTPVAGFPVMTPEGTPTS